jgi:ABC-type spermidine/putrescine transport system permease subunit II
LVLPIFIVIPISFSSAAYLTFPPPGFSLRWYRSYLGSRQWLGATALSFEVGILTAALATLLGTPAAVALVRGRFPGKDVLNGFLVLPLVVPVIIQAIAIYHLYVRLHLVGSRWGLVLAHAVLAVPVVIITVSATLRNVDQTLEQAAMSLGAAPWQAFIRVTLPLIQPGIWSGAIFAFITSFDEVVIALFISGSTAITLPRQMWDGVRNEINPTVASVSSILIAMSVTLLVSVAFIGRKLEGARRWRAVKV